MLSTDVDAMNAHHFLAGKKVVVFDASYDLGPSYIEALLARGADVLAVCTDRSRLANIVGQDRLLAVEAGDLRQASWKSSLTDFQASRGGLDIAIFNDKHSAHPNIGTEDYADEDWLATFDHNIHAAFLFAKGVIPALKASKGGSLVFVSTSSSEVTLFGPNLKVAAAYEAANAALNRFAKRLAVELGSFHVNVNTLCAGNVDKENIGALVAQLSARAHVSRQDIVREMQARQKIPGFIPVAHVAEQLCHLVSPASKYITGHDLVISGGMHL